MSLETPAILVVDDNQPTREILKRRLDRQGFAVTEAGDGERAIELVRKHPFDLVLLDIVMPGLDGLGTLSRLRDIHTAANLPIIMLSAKEGSADVIEALKRGANDYVTKAEDFSVILARINTQLSLRRLNEQVREMAVKDSLTGIYNRRGFFELAEIEEKRFLRYGGSLHAIMVDLDRFKYINDTHGHRVGDRVLVVAASRCRKQLRSSDLIGRWGGEEFVILLPEIDFDGAQLTAQRLREVLSSAPIETPEGEIRVTLSAGVATFDGSCKNLGDLLNHADKALYEAKRGGRNQVHVYPPAESPKPVG